MAKLAPHLPTLAGAGWTASKPLPGGDFAMDGAAELEGELAAEYPFLDSKLIHRLVRSYGTRSPSFLGNSRSVADLGVHFGHGLYAAEANYLVAAEWARSADDILWRRSKLGLRFTSQQVAALESHVVARLAGVRA